MADISKVKLPNNNTEYVIKDSSAVANITRSGTTFTATKRDGTTFTFTQQDNNTTYTVATGDSNGQIKVTPSSGSAYNVNVKGLASGAYKAVDTAVTSGSANLITSGAVYTAIDNLPEPMIFKGSLGTGGTITTLPTVSSANEGFTYKVITAGTYASQSAKVGDLFISNGTDWIWIPSGDEPSGTVTSITLKATSPIAIDNSSAITTSGTRTLSHANSGVTAGTYRSVTVNATGHVTAGTNPTTLSGYGITDAKIANGVITLGSNTITPLTSHQTVTDNNPTLAWGTKSKVATIGSTEINVTMPSNPNTDKNVQVNNTNPTSGTWYYPVWYTATSGTGQLNANDGFRMYGLQGTASAAGASYISLGNSITTGTAGNKRGFVRIYSEKAGYADIACVATATSGASHIFPATGGTVLNTGTTSFTQSLSSGTKIGTIKIDGTSTDIYCQTNTNTTYTLGTSGNNITLTPSSGSAQSITAPYATSAGSATKATQDGSGNTITSTYVKKSGDTMTGALYIRGSAASKPLHIRGICGMNEVDGSLVDDTLYLQYGNTTTDEVRIGNTGGGRITDNGMQYNGNAASATKATQDSSGNTIVSTYMKKSGDTMTGALTMAGTDIQLRTTDSSSDDSSDIAWYYGNGQEKCRLWTANSYTSKSGLNYRVYKSDGTSLYTGTIPLADGTGASGNWGINVTGSSASCTGNAASATKLQTARSIALGTDLQGSANFDGSGNITISASSYQCSVNGGNKANYPWHRIAYVTGVSGTYTDKDAIFVIRRGYAEGEFGIIKVSLRTNNTSQACNISAKWIIRSGFAANDIVIAQWGVTGNVVYADIFLKCSTYPRTTVYQMYGSRSWTLINSNEVSDTTTTDKKTSTEVYKDVATAATEIHNQAYTTTTEASDRGNVNYANSAGTATDSTKLPLAGGTMTGSITCTTSGANFKYGNITIYGGGTNGGINSMVIGDDVTIGDCNKGGCFGMKSTGSNAGFRFYNSSGTSIGGLQSTNGTLQWFNSSETAYNVSYFTATPTSGQVVITDGTTGGIKSSGYTIAKSVPSDAKFTDTNTWRPVQDNLVSDSTTDCLSAAQGKALANGSARDGTKLNKYGDDTMNGCLTSYRETTTGNNFPAGFRFSVKDTTTGLTNSDAYIYAYQDHGSTNTYGCNMVIRSSGGMFIGGGESPSNHYLAKGASYSGEDCFITSDGNIYIQTNGNTIANRVGFYIDTSAALIPCKADSPVTLAGSIGTADYRWSLLYVNSIQGGTAYNTQYYDATTQTTGYCMHGRTNGNKYSCIWSSSKLNFYVDTTNVGNVSDRQLKSEIDEIDPKLLEAIAECKIYQYKAFNRDGLISVGIMAQDLVEKCEERGIRPENYELLTKMNFIQGDDTLYYSIDYNQYATFMIDYLQKKVKELESKIEG